MHSIQICPACGGQEFTIERNVKDYTVSHETFDLLKCSQCALLITSPQPASGEMASYYQSTNYISHTNSKQGLFNKIYQVVRNQAIKNKISLIKKYDNNQIIKLLDYGCGTGQFLAACSKQGIQIEGVEPTTTARESASAVTRKQIHENIDQVNDTFSSITLWHVLEHVQPINEILSALKERLTKNGTMFIAVPNHSSHDAYIYKEYWAAYDVPRHLWHFTPTSMQHILKKHNLYITKILPMKFDSYYVSLLSEQYKRGRQTLPGVLNAFVNGLSSNLKATSTEYSSQIFVVKQ